MKKNRDLFEEAKNFIPGGVNSPVRSFKSVNSSPLFIDHASGPFIFDCEGNKYLDLVMSFGPLMLGHSYPAVVEMIQKALLKGTSYGACHENEVEIAKLICTNIPFVEKIRFMNSGTEAVMTAIRLARGFTKRDLILKFEGCYHGHSDSMLVKAGSGLLTFGNSMSSGIPESTLKTTISINLDDDSALESVFSQYGKNIAGVIIEPIPANAGLLIQRNEFLHKIRNLCNEWKSVLIFDEVISGFRFGFCGASKKFNIIPDLVTYGKIIGGGLPVGAVAGKKEILDLLSPVGSVYQAGTLSGNPLSLAAGLSQLRELKNNPNIYTTIESNLNAFVGELSKVIEKLNIPVIAQHSESIFWLAFNPKKNLQNLRTPSDIEPGENFKKFHTHLLENGVYFPPSPYEVAFLSLQHTQEILLRYVPIFESAFKKAYNLD